MISDNFKNILIRVSNNLCVVGRLYASYLTPQIVASFDTPESTSGEIGAVLGLYSGFDIADATGIAVCQLSSVRGGGWKKTKNDEKELHLCVVSKYNSLVLLYQLNAETKTMTTCLQYDVI